MTFRVVILLSLASCLPASAQTPTFRADSQLALIGVHVTANKHYVTGLKSSDFQLLEDGEPRPITVFEDGAHRSVPVEIVLLFDNSGSVTGLGLLNEKLFRDNLLADLPQVVLSVYGFGSRLARFSGPTQDPQQLRRAFQGVVQKTRGEVTFDLGKPKQDSLIYEAVEAVVKETSRNSQPATRLVLVVSDGIVGGDTSPDKAAAAAREMGLPVYPLVIGHQMRVREYQMKWKPHPRPGPIPPA